MDTGNNIQYLMRPSSIALLGCSESNVGGQTLKNLLSNGYQGKLYPVHPKHETVCGVACYKSLMEIPDDVDCCLVALRSTLCEGAVDEMKEKGVKAAVFLASGFSEVGKEGRELQKRLTEKLRESGIAACGPNCLGFINFHDNVLLYSAATDISSLKGPIGLVSHSGSICIAFQSAHRGAGFSYNISCGNEAGLSVPDYFRAMIEDEHTEIIVGFLEAIRDPEGLKEVAKLAVERNKPIIILKVGRSEVAQKTASAHSGALASPANVSDAFFRQNHILQVNSFDELNETCELLLKLKNIPLAGPAKVSMTAISGGQLGFCSDVAAEQGLTFANIGEEAKGRIRAALPDFATAKNPLDVTTALFDTDAYQECVRALAADEETGLIMICQDCEANMCADEIGLYRHIVQALCKVRDEIDKPMAVFSPLSSGLVQEYADTFAEHGIPLLQGAHESMRAAALYFQWMQYRKEVAEELPAESGEKIPFEFGTDRSLSERASKALLSAYGIPVAADILAGSKEAAVAAAENIGYPVVMKIDSADILHKTEAKVVKLGVGSAEEAARVYDELMANAHAYNPKARINGVSVQEMVDKGVEVMLGMKSDPVFGPCVMVGIGGIFVEIFKDMSLRLAPVDKSTAMEMIQSLKGKKLLYGARGAEPADVDALCDTIVKFSRLAYDYQDRIAEMDINPIIVLADGKGVKAVDALVVQREAE
jgi:acyl-CoA synthetase (NDP forming)